jgi:hypothetical protein
MPAFHTPDKPIVEVACLPVALCQKKTPPILLTDWYSIGYF